ncbi:hypothetical protein B0H65DRAFT_552929 [Neurospora tetraspora]|uniref:RING-type domain-containing protein n=1 Tax=Neurospora tetraspora TaxID=94610 RepID=A0AAE0J8G5_9PEZI|nr:hypothetical protein B0H65DRAFT_552929 [Neurospora tetraspora]
MPGERTLKNYLPDDTSWSNQTVEVLKTQCIRRDLTFTTGHRKELESLLKTHRYTHNPPGKASRIKDYSDLEAGIWAKNFTLTPGGEERITVVVGEENNYVLRYLLNCPEPLRWQSSFLPSELGEIFRLSHLYHHLNSGGHPDPFCAICFKPMSFTARKQCGIGRHLVHPRCMEIFYNARNLPNSGSEHGCVLCEDADELVWEVKWSGLLPGSLAGKSPSNNKSKAKKEPIPVLTNADGEYEAGQELEIIKTYAEHKGGPQRIIVF